jgi:hypothetical protein
MLPQAEYPSNAGHRESPVNQRQLFRQEQYSDREWRIEFCAVLGSKLKEIQQKRDEALAVMARASLCLTRFFLKVLLGFVERFLP